MDQTHELTLLDVIQAVSEVTQNDQEITIAAMRALVATMDAAA